VDVGGVLVGRGWNLNYIMAVLNSNACNFAWRCTSKPFRGEYRSANKQFIAPLPIPKTKDQKPLARIAKALADLHARRLKTAAAAHRRFQVDLPPKELIRSTVLPPSLSRKLAGFDIAPRDEVFAELEKLAERRLRPAERGSWDDYLTRQADELARVRRTIDDRMGELNERVNALFGINPEDVKRIGASESEG